ncbi:MAG: HEAT repeat domain-containing protein [Candidatus Scalindua sp.]|nr:HEAT repeat domain-containing protein [Candidatus Scalindua sp.]
MNRKIFTLSVGILLWVLALSCELVAGEMILHADRYSTANLIIAFSVHTSASILSFLVFWIYSVEKSNELKFYSYQSGLVTFFLPVIGILGAASSFLLVRFVLKRKGYFSTTEDPLENEDKDSLLFEDISDTSTLVKEETNIEPIMDILNGDDPALKRGAINLLRQMGSREAVHLLKKCISDPHEEVRFYTSAALKKLNDAYIQQLKNVKEEIAREKPSIPNLQKLGDICTKYAESDLCEQSARDYYLSLAKNAFNEALILDPENREITTNLGYVCLELKEYEEAEKYLKWVVTRNPEHVDALLWLCRLYYEKWDLKALVENIHGMNPVYHSEAGDPYNRMLLDFWTKQHEVYSDG